jgi:cation diffusion facilitator family transporter
MKELSARSEEIGHDTAKAEKQAAALSTLLAALLITAAKVTVGIWTGSLGILAEAADSALDVVAALLTFGAVRVSGKPADESHPYGHGKVENMAALVETLLLLFTCAWIIFEAISRLFFKSVEIDANVWAFVVVAISMIIDLNRMRALQRAADKHDSQALQASALRFRTDLWTSSVVLLGLTLVRVQEWLGGPAFLLKADAVAGLGVAVVVLFLGVRLGKSAMEVLLDTAPAGLAEGIGGQVERIEGVSSCRQVRVRRSGAESFVDLVLEVDGDISFDNAHQITARVEEVVRELVPRCDVVVHYEPGEESSNISALVGRLARQVGAQAHSIWVRQSNHRYHVELHVEVERGWSLTKAHDLATRLELLIKEAAPEVAEVVIHLEPVGDSESPIARLPHTDHAEIEAEIVSLVDSLVGEGACHRVNIWEEPQGLVASLHCSLRSELSVEEAHDLSEQWEGYLRERIPALRRVLIHLEPS